MQEPCCAISLTLTKALLLACILDTAEGTQSVVPPVCHNASVISWVQEWGGGGGRHITWRFRWARPWCSRCPGGIIKNKEDLRYYVLELKVQFLNQSLKAWILIHHNIFLRKVSLTTCTVNFHSWLSTVLNASCGHVFICLDETKLIYTIMESAHSNARSPAWLKKTPPLSLTKTLFSFLWSAEAHQQIRQPFQGNNQF
jgi:hypothetical protein